MNKNIHYAVFSGFCASLASMFGKLSGLETFQNYVILKISFFLLMLLCNAGVWTLFVKALHQSDSSLIATVISSASNYALSAITGFLIFGEVTSLVWWSGLSLILAGLLMVLKNQGTDDVMEEIKRK